MENLNKVYFKIDEIIDTLILSRILGTYKMELRYYTGSSLEIKEKIKEIIEKIKTRIAYLDAPQRNPSGQATPPRGQVTPPPLAVK